MNKFLSLGFIKLLIGCLTVGIASCSPATSTVITQEGEYASPRGAYTLKVFFDANRVVSFEILNSTSSSILASGKTGSVYQRWFFFWETDAKLWVQSSDVGLFAVWEISGGLFKEHQILAHDDLFLKSVPPPVVNALSNTMRGRFGL